MTKLKSQYARATAEWKGKTPDTAPPLQVQLRVLTRQGGACAITGVKFAPGDKKRLDHKTPIIDGGKNWREQFAVDSRGRAQGQDRQGSDGPQGGPQAGQDPCWHQSATRTPAPEPQRFGAEATP